jgi:dienelactone hydrolase
MAGLARWVLVETTVACTALLAVGCGGGDTRSGESKSSVTSQVVSDATTQDIHVFAPQGTGTSPVVVALHGINGTGQDMGAFATRLARAGMVVFAPTYRSDLTTPDGLSQAESDIVCSYRFARTSASQHGGDLTQPLTALGWSLGADFAVLGGLSPGPSPDEPCPGDKPPPDVVVGISGCYYEYEGKPITWFDDVSGWGNKGADFYLLAGDQDTTCPAWQSEKLASSLHDAGYHVHLVKLTGADHYAPIFHEVRNGKFQAVTTDPAGRRAVQVVLDAIATRQHASADQ